MIRPTTPSFAFSTAMALGLALLVALPSRAAAPLSGIDPTAIDAKVRPQDDLFRHVNGTWLKKTQMPADKAFVGVLQDVSDTTQDHLRALIEAAQQRSGDPEAQKIGDLYASYMNEPALEALGIKPLAEALASVDAVTDRKQLVTLMGKFEPLGVEMPLAIAIQQDGRDSTRYVADFGQSGLGLPDRDYYLKEDDARFKETREKYVVYLSRLLTLAGDKDTEATAKSVLALETEIARVQWTRVENRDPIKTYNKVELAGLPKLAPELDWDTYFAALGLSGKVSDVLVDQPSFITGFGKLLASTPIATWKAYARTHLLSAYAGFLNKDFVDARFAFVGTALSGRTQNLPRWKRGGYLVQASIGDGLGKLYVATYFPPENKARMEALVANLLETYRLSIDTLDWMTPETKKAAQEKLAKFNTKIGYPKRWLDYGTLEIRRDDLVGNVMRARAFESARQIAKLGRPIDRDEWDMTPQTVNAYYNPSMNEIVFPAAFLQSPTFNVRADDAANYGAIGAVIGHEISHGFDDQGSQYDGDGNLRDWWTAQDRERFAAKTSALVAQYNAFKPLPGYTVNGELTLGENIADNSGLAIAYKAYHLSLHGKPAPVIGGLTGDQRFFFGYAQVWRGKTRESALLQQIKSDPHSPEEFRVTGAVRNHPGFYSTFKVKPGDRMYLAPAERVSIW